MGWKIWSVAEILAKSSDTSSNLLFLKKYIETDDMLFASIIFFKNRSPHEFS